MLEHVGVKRGLQVDVRRLQRAQRISPSLFLDVGVSADLLEAANPDLAAGVEGRVVVVLDRLGDGFPEGLEGRVFLDCHDEITSTLVKWNSPRVKWSY